MTQTEPSPNDWLRDFPAVAEPGPTWSAEALAPLLAALPDPYDANRRRLPYLGQRVATPAGSGKVVALRPETGEAAIELPDGTIWTLAAAAPGESDRGGD